MSVLERLHEVPGVEDACEAGPVFLFRSSPVSVAAISEAVSAAGVMWRVEVHVCPGDEKRPLFALVPIGDGTQAKTQEGELAEAIGLAGEELATTPIREVPYQATGTPDLSYVTIGEMLEEIGGRDIAYAIVYRNAKGQTVSKARGDGTLLIGMLRRAERWLHADLDTPEGD